MVSPINKQGVFNRVPSRLQPGGVAFAGNTPPVVQQGTPMAASPQQRQEAFKAQNMRVNQPQPTNVQAAQPQQLGQIQQQVAPQQQFGLSGSEQAIKSGLGAAVSALEQTQGGVQSQLQNAANVLGGNFGGSASRVDPMTGQSMFTQAAQGVGEFSGAGLQAQQRQAALTGALGAEAQAEAINSFNQSPGQQFLREQGELGIINQASALGGLGGGNVQRELARFGTGLAQQDFANQVNMLNQLSGQGLQAAGQQGQFLSQAGQQQGQLAGMNAQLGTQASLANAANRLSAAQGQAQLLGQGAGIQAGLGQQAANLFAGTGQNMAAGRLQAGRDIASQVSQGSSALANLANQQSGGISDMIGQGSSNLANLLSGAGQFSAGQQQDIMAMLANMAVGQGSQNAAAHRQMGQSQAGLITGAADSTRSGLIGLASLFG